MQTSFLDLSQIEKAATLLQKGGIVAFPTETVYGLGASIWDEDAIKKIYIAKGRPADNPLIAHVATMEQAKECAFELPPAFFELAKAFWPGPLSIVVKKSSKVPLIASAGLNSIAIRMPMGIVARQLIEKAGFPIVAPSANKSGFPSATCYEHVRDDFTGVIDGIICGEACEIGIESTVISLLNPEMPVLLRSGIISPQEIEAVLKRPVSLATSNDKPLSPGQKYRHYSPNTPLYIFDEVSLFHAESLCRVDAQKKCALFCSREIFESLKTHLAPNVHSLEFLGELNPSNLYHSLRKLDKNGFDLALILSSKEEAIWPRLLHATSGQVNKTSSLEEVK